jgi:ketosteroid isomerase-like protein
MRKLLLLAFILASFTAIAQPNKEEKQIRSLLQKQTVSWNNGDVEGFMQTYLKSDSLMFIGKNGVVWGWQPTLENYKKSYPDTASMGQLSFNIIQVKPISKNYYFVVGKWMLQRTAGNLSGHYTLLMRKINGEWKIVADHSS